jgi:DNA-binding beta-propeller fold protein YncE
MLTAEERSPSRGSRTVLTRVAQIEIPDAHDTSFDHGAFDAATRRVFLAHTRRGRLEVIDHDARRHLATLDGFAEAAGVVADGGRVFVTNRGAAELAWVDARTLKTNAVFKTGPRPNGVAIVPRSSHVVVACIGDEKANPMLEVIDIEGGRRWSAQLPGRPRWCASDAAGRCIHVAIREPSMIWVADLPDLGNVQHWALPVIGAHGVDIDLVGERLYVACDEGMLVEIDLADGKVGGQWPLPGVPDATFFNPASGLVHVAVGEPGLVQSIDRRDGKATTTATGRGAKTTAFVPPDCLYVFSPAHDGALVLVEEQAPVRHPGGSG